MFGAGNECLPASLGESLTQAVVNGPYICVNNDGQPWDGCRGTPCIGAGQYCATDQTGSQFCSVACATDSSCGNPGVACCNAACMDGGHCCGVCTHDAGACQTSADCGGATPCCSVSGNCITAPIDGTYCRCSRTSDCDFLPDQECIAEARDLPPVALTGPYSCLPNIGQAYGGCRGKPCGAVGQVCATDRASNEFGSIPCTSDTSCNNSGVACCNAPCQDGGKCCGLCGH